MSEARAVIEHERLAAVVLCGGRSRRMGRDKAAVAIDGETLLARVVRAVASTCHSIVVVAAPDQALQGLPTPPATPVVRVVRDAIAFEGPLAGLAAGLAALGDADPARVFVVGVDAVRVTPELVRAFAAFGGADDAVAVRGEDGRPWPLPVLVPVARARPLASGLLAAGERSLRSLVAALAPVAITADELLARSPALRAVDPTLRGLDDADDEVSLARLLAEDRGTFG